MAAPVLSAFVVVVFAAAAEPNVVVAIDPARDAALPCAANDALAHAVELMLPNVSVVTRPSSGGDAFQAALGYDGAAWNLSLVRADGSSALSRKIDGAADACGLVANASAAIVDRYFSDVVFTGEDVRIATIPPPPPLVRGLSVAAGPTVRAPITSSATAGLDVAVTARIQSHAFAQLGLWGAGLADETAVTFQGADRGTLRARTFSAFVAGGACAGEPSARAFCGGAFAGALLLNGDVVGTVYQRAAQTVAAPQVGALAWASQPLGRQFELQASVRAGAPLLRTGIAVEGTSATLWMPAVDVEAGLRLAWAKSF